MVDIKYAAVNEFLLSLRAYTDKSAHKVFELGPAWARDVTDALPAGFDEIAAPLEKVGIPFFMVETCPDPGDPQRFITWLGSLSRGELYDRVLTDVGDPSKVPPHLGALRDQYVQLLTLWHEHYWRRLDPRITDGLARAPSLAAEQTAGLSPEAAVEWLTGGVLLDPAAHVVLIPQYHCRPLNIFHWYRDRCVIAYPCNPLPPEPGAIPPDLRKFARALDDDSRLQILRFLAGGVRSFTEIVKQTGLAKSTVHHHMVTLRASGLVRVHVRPEGADRFSLRPEGVDRAAARLQAFLKEE